MLTDTLTPALSHGERETIGRGRGKGG